MAEESLKKKTVKGVAWSAVERFSSQGVNFVFNILIARILLPEDYGVVALLAVFLMVSRTFIDSGFSSALIKKANCTDADYCTVFYFNFLVSVFFFILLWFAAPLIASFYKIPLLTNVTRVMSLTLVFNAPRAVHETILKIRMDFKTKAYVTLIGVFATGTIGLVMAHKGFGVWALVAQNVLGSVLRTILIWIVVKWRPKLIFSIQSFKEMFSFGSRMLGASLLDTIYNNIYPLVIGKFYTLTDLGLYGKAESFASFPSSSLTTMLQQVTYPALSSVQNEEERLRSAYRRLLNVSAYVVFPMMIGLAAIADPFIRIVLTDKWEGSIYFLQIICFALMWYPIHAINLNILLVKGHSDYFLKLEIVKKIVGVGLLFVTVLWGVVAMCYGQIVMSLICLIINTYYNKELIDYGLWDQLKDMLPIIALSLTMGVLVLFVVSLMPTLWSKLIVGVVSGVVYYLVLSYVFKFSELKELADIVLKR